MLPPPGSPDTTAWTPEQDGGDLHNRWGSPPLICPLQYAVTDSPHTSGSFSLAAPTAGARRGTLVTRRHGRPGRVPAAAQFHLPAIEFVDGTNHLYRLFLVH